MDKTLELSDLIITNIFSAIRLNHSSNNSFTERKNRERWALAFKRTGKSMYISGNKKYYSDSLHPILLPKGSSYSWIGLEDGECLFIEFDCEKTSDTLYSFSINDNSILMKNFISIEKRRIKKEPYHNIKNICDLYKTLLFLTESNTDSYVPSKKFSLVQPAVDYMLENYNDPYITNDFLSELCQVSTVYFRKLFKQLYSVPPMQHLNKIRMEHARELLKSDYGSIAQVAENVGYTSLYHFSKMFKKYYGLSPSKYDTEG